MITFNPYTSHLYFKISYMYLRTFLQFYRENSDLLRNIDDDEKDNNHLDEDEGVEEGNHN